MYQTELPNCFLPHTRAIPSFFQTCATLFSHVHNKFLSDLCNSSPSYTSNFKFRYTTLVAFRAVQLFSHKHKQFSFRPVQLFSLKHNVLSALDASCSVHPQVGMRGGAAGPDAGHPPVSLSIFPGASPVHLVHPDLHCRHCCHLLQWTRTVHLLPLVRISFLFLFV